MDSGAVELAKDERNLKDQSRERSEIQRSGARRGEFHAPPPFASPRGPLCAEPLQSPTAGRKQPWHKMITPNLRIDPLQPIIELESNMRKTWPWNADLAYVSSSAEFLAQTPELKRKV